MTPRRLLPLGLLLLAAFSLWLSVCGGSESADRAAPADDDLAPPDDDQADDDDDDDDDDLIPPVAGEPPVWSAPVQIGANGAQAPSVHIRDAATVHVTYFTPQPEAKLRGMLSWVSLSGEPLSAGEPVMVAADVYEADWLYDQQHIDMLGVRATQIIHLLSDDGGATWRQGKAIANQDSWCDGEARGFPVRDGQGRLRAAFGYNHDSNLFGCVPQMKLATVAEGEWSAPIDVGGGYPVGLFLLDDATIVPGTFGLFTSADGATFSEVSGGDQTRNQVQGDDAALLSNGKIWMITTYSWGVGDNRYVALVEYDPADGSWISPRWDLAKGQAPLSLPRLAVDGQTMVAAWAQGGMPMARVSRDGGASWSAAAQVGEQGVEALQLDAAFGRAVLAYETSTGVFATDFSY